VGDAKVTPGTSDPDDVDVALAALRSLVLASQAFRLRFAEHAGIGVIDSVAMSHLAASGPLTIGDLADRVGLAPSGATALVDRLERARLARRVVRPENRRTVGIALTSEGARLLTRSAQWARDAIHDVGADRVSELGQLLNALADGLGRRAEQFHAATNPEAAGQPPRPSA
jgi:DNA-binding MarR family transcriptional regulator